MFYDIADQECDVEQRRIKLAELKDFAPHECFKRIDQDTKGEHEEDEIMDFCNDNEVKCSFHEARRLID